jgi:hypothetical protein
MFAMFPIVNLAAKGFLQFVYNISSSVGSNIIKLAVGTVSYSGGAKSDLECFKEIIDS